MGYYELKNHLLNADDEKYQPSISSGRPPKFNLDDLRYNWPHSQGNGDRFKAGHSLFFPPVSIRPNNSMEACKDTQQPVFDTCIIPLVMWSNWIFNFGESLSLYYARLWASSVSNSLPRSFLPVLATPHGLSAPHYFNVFSKSLFDKDLVTLAQLSGRHISCAINNNNNNNNESMSLGRCFQVVHLCRLKKPGIQIMAAAQDLVRFYQDAIQKALDDAPKHMKEIWSGAGPEVLRVVIALRPNRESRSLLNEEEIIAQCNSWIASEPMLWKTARCVGHHFGTQGMLIDMGIMNKTDVLLCIHGAECNNAFFMLNGSSMVGAFKSSLHSDKENSLVFHNSYILDHFLLLLFPTFSLKCRLRCDHWAWTR
jgi:hypothetical protein